MPPPPTAATPPSSPSASQAQICHPPSSPSPSVLTLERAFPVTQKVELQKLKARDRARHARILQSFVSGIVDFSIVGTSDPFLVGELDDQLQDSLYDFLEIRGINDELAIFLHKYMRNKCTTKFIRWMEIVKSFMGTKQRR